MTFRSIARRRSARWVVLLAIVLITGMLASPALAITFATTDFTQDDEGANDEPGQKDLTGQASKTEGSNFFTAWQWDDTAWSGNNTGDGCSLFDTDATGAEGDDLVDYAVCATVTGGGNVQGQDTAVTLVSVTLYSCSDKRADRCTNPVLLKTYLGSAAGTYCTVVDSAEGIYDTFDTQIYCNITALAGSVTPAITTLTSGTLLNTCSYPSKEPNSDPSDCVLTPQPVNTSVATLASATWSVTLNDTATMSPIGATGSVVFKLWATNTAGVCSNLVWTSPSVTLTNGVATTAGGGTPSGGNTITNLTYDDVDTDGIYYWTVDYTPTGLFNASSSACGATGETIAINLPVTTTS